MRTNLRILIHIRHTHPCSHNFDNSDFNDAQKFILKPDKFYLFFTRGKQTLKKYCNLARSNINSP